MSNYTALDRLQDDYVRFPGLEPHFEIYVPKPNGHLDIRLVHSVLELIAKQCGLEKAKVHDGKIVVQRKGGRYGEEIVGGTPNAKRIEHILLDLGYTDAKS